jgi:hypothetical protein
MNAIARLFRFILIVLVILNSFSCARHDVEHQTNTIFKLGFKMGDTSTGPLENSGFVMRINDSVPPLFLTAHHVVAGIGNDQYARWDEVSATVKNAWVWSMHDSNYALALSENLPIRNAKTFKIDLAAFFIPAEHNNYLVPAKGAVHIGDTIQLFSRIVHDGDTSLLNPGVVIFASDSVLVYELLGFRMARIMSGTSGSALINRDGDVVANSYGGFTIPNEEEKRNIVKMFPFLMNIKIEIGKTYGIGLPVKIIETSVLRALRERDSERKH